MSLVKTDTPGLLKDTRTGMVQPADVGEYRRILAARARRREDQDLRDRVARLERMLEELLSR